MNQLFMANKMTTAFSSFLDAIATKVALQGFNKYSGGLDTKENKTGTHSYFAEHKGLEIMFHVAALLPSNSSEKQQLERKRFVANDFVLIIFKEDQNPLNISTLASNTNQVVIVIEPTTDSSTYVVSVCARLSVPRFGPHIMIPPVFAAKSKLAEWLLVKIINGDKASMYSPSFEALLLRTRRELFSAITNAKSQSTKTKFKLF